MARKKAVKVEADPRLNAVNEALKFIKDGMIVGLGSGTTANLFIAELGKKNIGRGFKCIWSSNIIRISNDGYSVWHPIGIS